MELTHITAIHLASATGALLLGPVALWARLGMRQRPRLHRAFGYAWVTLMIATAITAIFIRDDTLPNVAGYTPIHILVPVTFLGLWRGIQHMLAGNIAAHRALMQKLYYGACVIAGAFTLLPSRYLGRLLWGSLGVI